MSSFPTNWHTTESVEERCGQVWLPGLHNPDWIRQPWNRTNSANRGGYSFPLGAIESGKINKKLERSEETEERGGKKRKGKLIQKKLCKLDAWSSKVCLLKLTWLSQRTMFRQSWSYSQGCNSARVVKNHETGLMAASIPSWVVGKMAVLVARLLYM